MQRIFLLAILLFLVGSPAVLAQTWLARNPVQNRAGVYQFVINGVAYVGGGEDDTVAYADLRAYDPATDTWTPRASLPGVGRSAAASFVVNGKAYVVGGFTFDGIPAPILTETWIYDPAANTWTARAPYPGNAGAGAMGFAIGGIGYVGGGSDFDNGTSYSDFYSYDPVLNHWTARASLPAPLSTLGGAFTLNGAGHLAGGLRFSSAGFPDITNQHWSYSPAANQWQRRADLPTDRAYCGALATGGYGYVAEGISSFLPPTPTRDLLRYDAAANTWTAVPPGQGPAGVGRGVPVFFAVAGSLYLGGGINPLTDDLLSDFWRLPGFVTGTTAPAAPAAFTLAPNPAATHVRLLNAPAAVTELLDAAGRVVRVWPVGQTVGEVADVPAGVYLVRCGTAVRRLLIER